MKRKYYLLSGLMVAAVLCFVLAGCSKKDEVKKIDEVTVDQTNLTFTQKGDSGEFNVACTEEWHLDAVGLEVLLGPDIATIKDFSIGPVGGKGNAKITVTLDNDLTESYDVALKIVGKDNTVIVKLKAIAE
jgi:hypothetical protein